MAIVNLVKPKIDTFVLGTEPIKTLSMKIPNKSFGDVFVKSDVTKPETLILIAKTMCENGYHTFTKFVQKTEEIMQLSDTSEEAIKKFFETKNTKSNVKTSKNNFVGRNENYDDSIYADALNLEV